MLNPVPNMYLTFHIVPGVSSHSGTTTPTQGHSQIG